MKLKELFTDWFIGTPLYEMAYTRDVAHQKCTNIELTLCLHVLKTLIMPASRDVPHWKKEIRTFLRGIVDIRLKPKNKRLPTSLYREWLIEEPDLDDKEVINKRIEWLKADYEGENIVVPTTIFADYHEVMDRVISDLGNGVVTVV